MTGIWRRFVPAGFAVALVLALAACEQPSPTEQPVTIKQDARVGGSFTLVRDLVLIGQDQPASASGVIGASGGSVTILGHTITIPAGAVTQPTVFTLAVLPTGYVEVDLSATLGGVDVGGKGFRKPVPVTLTYARSSNATDASRLTVLRILSTNGYSEFEVMPSRVDPQNRTVTVELDHFSRYALAYP